MNTKSFVSVVLACVMLMVPCLQLQIRGDTPTAAPKDRVFFDTSLNSADPAGTYAKLWSIQKNRKLTFEENMDLAMSLLLQQQWEQAAGAYKITVGSSDNPSQKAAAICGAAQCLAATHQWREAGELMNQANQLLPSSKEAATLRYAYWKNAGDEFEAAIALDRTEQLNLGMDGTPVCGPITGIVILVVFVGIVATWFFCPTDREGTQRFAALAFPTLITMATSPLP